MGEYNAVILGGGKSPIDKNLPKGNTIFNGISLAGLVYDAVVNGHDFNKVALVMNADDRINLRSQDKFVEPTFCKGAWLSGYKGVKAIDDGVSDYVLVAADLPLLDERVVSAFIDRIKDNKDADILIPLIARELNELRFPARRRTYQPLQEGDFVAGNLGYLSQNVLRINDRLLKKIAVAYQCKQQAIRMAISCFGLNTILRLHHPKVPLVKNLPEKLFPKLSIKELDALLSDFINVNVRFIEFPYPESAFDVDNLRHLELAKQLCNA